MRFSQEETSVDNLRALCLRWNRAVEVLVAGSEFIDDPETVVRVIQRQIAFHGRLFHRKGELGLPYKQPTDNDPYQDVLGALIEAKYAIDELFAQLILADKEFVPSKSGRPWDALLKVNKTIVAMGGGVTC